MEMVKIPLSPMDKLLFVNNDNSLLHKSVDIFPTFQKFPSGFVYKTNTVFFRVLKAIIFSFSIEKKLGLFLEKFKEKWIFETPSGRFFGILDLISDCLYEEFMFEFNYTGDFSGIRGSRDLIKSSHTKDVNVCKHFMCAIYRVESEVKGRSGNIIESLFNKKIPIILELVKNAEKDFFTNLDREQELKVAKLMALDFKLISGDCSSLFHLPLRSIENPFEFPNCS